MAKNIRTILMPFLTISLIFGLRIANLPINHLKLWFNLLYVLLVWVVYYFLSTSALILPIIKARHFETTICYYLEIFTTLLSLVFGIYHDKKFQNCLKKLDDVDNTLLKLGTITNYDKLFKKTVWLIAGWFMIVILTNCSTALFVKDAYNCDITAATFYIFILNYFFHINFIGDLTTASIFEFHYPVIFFTYRYIGLKFDQANEHLHNLMRNNKHKIKRACENSMIYSNRPRFSKALSNKRILRIVILLHLELRKIACEIDLIFGTQMTFKMACYFCWIAYDLREIFYAILINNYVKARIMFIIMNFFWFSHNVFKFLFINHICEVVTTKASATGDLLTRLTYFTCNVEIREIISQFSLRIIYTPLRFYGIGFFQFGYKFLYKFIMSVATVLVIIIQMPVNK